MDGAAVLAPLVEETDAARSFDDVVRAVQRDFAGAAAALSQGPESWSVSVIGDPAPSDAQAAAWRAWAAPEGR